MKLRMNQEMTRVVDASQQPFDFLGYTFGPFYVVRSPEAYLGAQPSKVRIKRLYGKVRDYFSNANTDPLEEVEDALNRMLVDWLVQARLALSQAQGQGEGNATIPDRRAVQEVWARLLG